MKNLSTDKLVAVNIFDHAYGLIDKKECHDGNGILHRAFSVFLFNDSGELLIQQRSKKKRLWPMYWSNTCCSHPRSDEPYETAARRRLLEECSIDTELKYLYKFRYTARYKDIGSENECCAVLIGKSNQDIKKNPEEINDSKWISIPELIKDIEINYKNYTPWFQIEIKELTKNYIDPKGAPKLN